MAEAPRVATRAPLAGSLLVACATTRAPATVAPAPAGADCARVAVAVAALGAGEASSLAAAGIVLRAAAGERTLAGDAATDERVSEAVAVACVRSAAAVVVRTDCGNAALVGLTWRDGAWRPAGHLAMVGDARPGHCLRSVAQVTAASLTSAEGRELVAETEAASDDGDEETGRVLRVARLADDGSLRWYEGAVPLGSFDAATGAATQGRWDLVEELPVPRDLYVEQRPLHGGLAGQRPEREIRRETWRVRGDALVRVDVVREVVRATGRPPAEPRP